MERAVDHLVMEESEEERASKAKACVFRPLVEKTPWLLSYDFQINLFSMTE